ncbi:peroxidase 5-like [Canna indica]|uniref:Peroxidase n=1 Tax=Canna indica TaxID=4628 RepID=A0AAQ3QEM8_9LILI|nr:peroxidase 5-like [Canna indica]
MALGRGATMVAALAVALMCSAVAASELKVGYYAHSCPRAEEIIQEGFQKALKDDDGIGADLLRMHFHDCFVRGCEGSLLVDSTPNNKAEKDGEPNSTIEDEAFEVIDDVKESLEAACKQTVSCADILAFLARDSVHHYGGAYYEVPAGRKDGVISKAEDTKELPPPSFNLNQLTDLFVHKGLSRDDLVALSGAHTIGVAHCTAFSDRLYNFTGKLGVQDPTLDGAYAAELKGECPIGNKTNQVNMDPRSPLSFDTSYYQSLLANRGLFSSDQTLLTTSATKYLVAKFAGKPKFFKKKFAHSMLKMGKIGVITEGTVRTNCRVINY